LIFEIIWTPTAMSQLEYWQTNDKKKLSKIKRICQDFKVTPKEGLGKPERLKYFKENVWSRRISNEHRLIYQIKDGIIYVLQCRYHY